MKESFIAIQSLDPTDTAHQRPIQKNELRGREGVPGCGLGRSGAVPPKNIFNRLWLRISEMQC